MSRHKQRDVSDCGPACLAFICDHFRLRLPVANLRQELGTDRIGTTAAGLVRAARRLGLSAKGVKGPAQALPTVPLPAIAHCLVDGRLLHYVVLVAWHRKHAQVMDPAVGRVEKWSQEKFKATWTGVLILMAPGELFQPGDHTVSPWRRFWSLLRPHQPALAQALVGAIVTTILGLGMSVYVQKVVDHVIPDGNARLLNLLAGGMLVVAGFKLLLGWCQSTLSLRMAQKIDAALILAYYRHLLRLPQPFFDTMRVGEITSRVADAVKIRTFLNQTLLNLILHPLVVAASLALMFCWSWQLGLFSAALLPAYALIYAVANRLNRTIQRTAMERAADFDAQLVESLQAQRLIRVHRLENLAGLRVEMRLVRLLKATWRGAVAGLGGGTAAVLVTQVHLVGLLWLGSNLVLDARLTPGQLMSCYTLAGYLTGPITALIGLNNSVQETLIAADRLFELMDLELERDQGTIELEPAEAAEIRFENVHFNHAGRDTSLQDISLVMPAGRITALSGGSGSGKSTLLALVQRLYQPAVGRIFVGGHDLAYLRLDSLRRNLAVLPQQCQLLSGTIVENLAPAEISPDMRRLLPLCAEVGILDFIEKLPQGFLAHVGENGCSLSGGQRQRLALVRVIYAGAPILLLDEPSSALDTAAEERLAAILQRLRNSGRTIVVATHAPRLIGLADRVVTMAEGRVVDIRDRAESAAANGSEATLEGVA
ncbi:MAG TPA: peptidase domain-containing ABC transporter [Lacunisphaera sp.]|nr:peptidase domain-containing ABC transporter [Lacunisphaera sp.]